MLFVVGGKGAQRGHTVKYKEREREKREKERERRATGDLLPNDDGEKEGWVRI